MQSSSGLIPRSRASPSSSALSRAAAPVAFFSLALLLPAHCNRARGGRDRSHRVADASGACVCTADAFSLPGSGECAPVVMVAAAASLSAVALALAAYAVWVRRRLAAADAAWQIAPRDLAFASPPVVLGQGTFGQILRAEVCSALPHSESFPTYFW